MAVLLRERSFAFGTYRAHSAFLSEGLLGQGEPTLRHIEQQKLVRLIARRKRQPDAFGRSMLIFPGF
jgi:hypothetical protein